jgi:phytanoyl-CoA hydroxylase
MIDAPPVPQAPERAVPRPHASVLADPAAWRAAFEADGVAVCGDALDGALLAALRERTDRLTDADAIPEAARAYVDLEPDRLDGRAVVQRVRRPYAVDPFFMEFARSEALLSLVRPLIGPNVRLHHGKINVKAPRVGSPLEWHQDWAFIPHTNPSLAIVSVLIDDCRPQSGPLQVLRASHRGPLLPHHHDGLFVGAIDPALLDFSRSIAVTGPAGTVAVHHPMAIHGSGFNRTDAPRRVLFFEYAATDAWPLFYGVEWADYQRRVVCGRASAEVRMEPVPVRMPHPSGSEVQGRIYEQQRSFAKRWFRDDAGGGGDA